VRELPRTRRAATAMIVMAEVPAAQESMTINDLGGVEVPTIFLCWVAI
jgi:hypothetical protein